MKKEKTPKNLKTIPILSLVKKQKIKFSNKTNTNNKEKEKIHLKLDKSINNENPTSSFKKNLKRINLEESKDHNENKNNIKFSFFGVQKDKILKRHKTTSNLYDNKIQASKKKLIY